MESILGITEKEMEQIEFHVKSTIGYYGFTSSDYDDLKQDLLIHVLKKLHHYTSDKSQRFTFISRICRNKLNSIIEMNKAQKRDYRNKVSEEKCVRRRDGKTIKRAIDRFNEGTVEASHRHKLFGRWKDVFLQTDLSQIIDSLSLTDQFLCKELAAKSKSDIAKELNIPRTTLNYRIKQLRKKFPESLAKYI